MASTPNYAATPLVGVVRIAVYMIRKGLPRGALRSHPRLGFSLDPAAPVLTTLLLDERE